MYAIFGGADFGAGFWDLVAGGAKRGERPREVIDHSIAPVWEANHVWLIFVFVVLWTCFPEAYASIMLTLFVPLTLAALGIVLRGASFAFRKAVFRTRDQRNFGAAFALSSVLVPYCLGAVVGSIASGRVPSGGKAGDPVEQLGQPHVHPRRGARRVRRGVPRRVLPRLATPGDSRTRRWSRTSGVRALVAGVAAGLVARSGSSCSPTTPTYLFDGLTSRALPLVILSAVSGVGALVLLARRGEARVPGWPPWWPWAASRGLGGRAVGLPAARRR